MLCLRRYYDTSSFKKTTTVDKEQALSQTKRRKAGEDEEHGFDQGFSVFNPIMATSMDMNKFIQSLTTQISQPSQAAGMAALSDLPACVPKAKPSSQANKDKEPKEPVAVPDLDAAWQRCQQMALILASKQMALHIGLQDLKKASLLTEQLNQDVSHVVVLLGEAEKTMKDLCVHKQKALDDVKTDLLKAATVAKQADGHLRFIKTVNKAHASSSMSEQGGVSHS